MISNTGVQTGEPYPIAIPDRRALENLLQVVDSEVVARDGIEPPTPAFSGLPDNAAKWRGISGSI